MLYWFIYGLFEIAITHEYISAAAASERELGFALCASAALLYHHYPVILIIIML